MDGFSLHEDMAADNTVERGFLVVLGGFLCGIFAIYPGIYVIPGAPPLRIIIGFFVGAIIMVVILNIGNRSGNRNNPGFRD